MQNPLLAGAALRCDEAPKSCKQLHLSDWRLIMEDRIIARNIGLTVGVIMMVALGLVTLSTIIGNTL
jgi:hypothetical protein